MKKVSRKMTSSLHHCFSRMCRQQCQTLRLGVPTMNSTVLMMTASNWVGGGGEVEKGGGCDAHVPCDGIVILFHGR